jgi:hypothetical protein
VGAAFQRLSESAAALNTISDELAKPIALIETALKKLNLGVSTWVEFAGSVDNVLGTFWDRSVGYAKVGGKWGIAIRTCRGDFGDEPDGEEWSFNDAPRAYRLEAVDKLPELLEQLVTEATETGEKLRAKIATTTQIANAIIAQSSLKDRLLAEIRKSKVVFYNTVVAQAAAVDANADSVTFRFSPTQVALRQAFEEKRAWLESLATQISGREIRVSSVTVGGSSRK